MNPGVYQMDPQTMVIKAMATRVNDVGLETKQLSNFVVNEHHTITHLLLLVQCCVDRITAMESKLNRLEAQCDRVSQLCIQLRDQTKAHALVEVSKDLLAQEERLKKALR